MMIWLKTVDTVRLFLKKFMIIRELRLKVKYVVLLAYKAYKLLLLLLMILKIRYQALIMLSKTNKQTNKQNIHYDAKISDFAKKMFFCFWL